MAQHSYRFYSFGQTQAKMEEMENRFRTVGVPYRVLPGVTVADDPKFVAAKESPLTWAKTYSHLQCLRAFVEDGDVKYAVICEESTHIRREISALMPLLIMHYETLGQDLLLLGYFAPTPHAKKIEYAENMTPLVPAITLFRYEHNVWGSQMYLINKTFARILIDTFTPEFAERTLDPSTGAHFSADWTMTKLGKRCMVWPLLGHRSLDSTVDDYVRSSHAANFDPEVFV